MRFLGFSFLILVSSIQYRGFNKYNITGFAQGTTYAITYYAADSFITKFQVDSILNSLDSSLSLYKSYSLINRFNNAEKGLLVDSHFKNVLRKSLLVYKETNGLFDITVQPLVQAWGFGVNKTDSLPDKKQVEAIMKCIGSSRLRLSANYLKKEKPCVKADMNGIAQGYSVDVIADFLESKGIKNYLVELGGEIRVKGRKQPSGEKMKIGVEAPPENEFEETTIQKTVSFDEGAITTSGSYRKYYESDGKKITHIINPKNGYPVQNELISVTVYANNAITADAYDNAIMLMGLKAGLSFVEKRKDIAAYFIYKDKEGNIRDSASSRFKKLMNP
jgi:FAD:protein FMN transferase